jgi:hypothetical protein
MPLFLRRYAHIRRTVPVRRRRLTPRRGPLRSKAFRWFVSLHPCHVCRCFPSDPCHTKNNGTSSKGPDSGCANLCRVHHDEYDAGREAFERKYGVDMQAQAARLWLIWNARSANARNVRAMETAEESGNV